jgi:hypothetical protein
VRPAFTLVDVPGTPSDIAPFDEVAWRLPLSEEFVPSMVVTVPVAES